MYIALRIPTDISELNSHKKCNPPARQLTPRERRALQSATLYLSYRHCSSNVPRGVPMANRPGLSTSGTLNLVAGNGGIQKGASLCLSGSGQWAHLSEAGRSNGLRIE